MNYKTLAICGCVEAIILTIGVVLVLNSGVVENEKNSDEKVSQPMLITGVILVLLAGLGIPATLMWFRT